MVPWGVSGKHLVAIVPLLALIVCGLFLWERKVQPRIDKLESRLLQGSAAGAVLSGGTLVLVDHVTLRRSRGRDPDGSERPDLDEERTRLTAVDPANGTKLATELLEGRGGCQGASPGRLWCDAGGLAIYDARRLTALARLDDAIQKAALGRPVPGQWRAEGPRAFQLLDDGRVAALDAETLAVTRQDAVPRALQRDALSGRPPSPGKISFQSLGSLCGAGAAVLRGLGGAPLDPAELLPPGRGRKAQRPRRPAAPPRWAVQRGEGDRARLAKGPVVSADSFLRPQPLGEDDPPLFLHHSSLDPSRDALRLSRLSPDGATAWTVELGEDACEEILVGESWIVTTTSARRRALAVDPRSGALRWRLAF